MVADGVSGSVKGEEASTFAMRTLSSKIINYLLLEDLELGQVQSKIGQFINETNQSLLKQYDKEVQSGRQPKTTLVGVLVIGQYLWAFNLGDSRAFLIRDGAIGN